MREIGSDFELPLGSLMRRRKSTGIGSTSSNGIFLASGRDALHWIVSALVVPPGSRVLLPAYLCESVLDPFAASGMRIGFYNITRQLQVDRADLERKLSPDTRLLLYIDYFGLQNGIPEDLVESKSPDAVVIQDASHGFLADLDETTAMADVRFASYRKLLPLPDGAAVWWGRGHKAGPGTARIRQSAGHLAAVYLRFLGGVLKALWLRFPWLYPRQTFRKLFSWGNALVDSYPKPAHMSALSRRILRGLNAAEVVRARRCNFEYLLAELKHRDDVCPMYMSLPEGVCPLGFPVLVHDRDGLARHLITRQIYPPVHWELPEAVDRDEFDSAWWVSDHILTVPMDQRYGEQDMERIVDVLRSYRGSEVLWPPTGR